MLRAVGLVVFWILSALAGTPRAKLRVWSKQYIKFGDQVADHTMAIMLGLVFSVQVGDGAHTRDNVLG
jgi:hypothetical protein